MLPEEIILGLSGPENNPTWKAVLMLLDASIESETARAISLEVKGEDRAWYCGRADALNSFKDILLNAKEEVAKGNSPSVE